MQQFSKSDQRGMAHLLVVALLVIVVGAIGFVAWKVSSNEDTTTNNSNKAVSDKAVEDACNKELKDKDLCKFASNYKLDDVSYQSAITTVADGKTSVMNMEVDGKGNSSMTTSEGGKETGAFITLNNATYIKNAEDGSWIKYSAGGDTSAPKQDDPTSDIKLDTNNLTENSTISYKNLGKESCGKLTCFKYQIIDTESPDTTQYIWFDTKDYMMQRWSSKTASGSTDMTFTYKAVVIKEPSPVTDFSAQGSADIQAAQEAAAATAAQAY